MNMVFGGQHGDTEPVGDLLVAEAFGNELGDFDFPHRELKQHLVRGRFRVKYHHRVTKIGDRAVVNGYVSNAMTLCRQRRQLIQRKPVAGRGLRTLDKLTQSPKLFRIDSLGCMRHDNRIMTINI